MDTRQQRRRNRFAAGTLKRFVTVLMMLSLFLSFTASAENYAAADSIHTLYADLQIDPDNPISSGKLRPGDAVSDWIALIAGRAQIGSSQYLDALREYTAQQYRTDNALDGARATEWHRISLTALSLGGDPTAFGTDKKGHPINLIADGTYNWSGTDSLGFQGLNGWIFSLITLDANLYSIPEGAAYTRNDILTAILKAQNSDGSFALGQGDGNVDITAMALQALAPYRNSTHCYPLESGSTTVMSAVKRATGWLAAHQAPDGSYQNSCSTAQVVLALCSLGIDPAHFSKDGHSLQEGLLSFRTEAGLFRYLPDDTQYDVMSTEQAIQALESMERLQNNQRRLFDFRAPMDSETQQAVIALSRSLTALDEQALQQQADSLYEAYAAIPPVERSYVNGYDRLAEAAENIPEEDPVISYNVTPPTEHFPPVLLYGAGLVAGAVVLIILIVRRKGSKKNV